MGLIHVSEILGDIIGDKPKLSRAIEEAGAAGFWDKAIDPRGVKHSEAVKVKDGVLYVNVDSPVWAQEFSLRKKEIIDKLNALSNDRELIKDIKFKTGKVRRA